MDKQDTLSGGTYIWSGGENGWETRALCREREVQCKGRAANALLQHETFRIFGEGEPAQNMEKERETRITVPTKLEKKGRKS